MISRWIVFCVKGTDGLKIDLLRVDNYRRVTTVKRQKRVSLKWQPFKRAFLSAFGV
jgi:hypothetical protein